MTQFMRLQPTVTLRPAVVREGEMAAVTAETEDGTFRLHSDPRGVYIESLCGKAWGVAVRIPQLAAWRDPVPLTYGQLVRYGRCLFAEQLVAEVGQVLS